MPPLVPGHKTIHQRNKSSPALSTMANAGGLKAAAKRTAFGDVSNTVNANRPSRDDSVISSKTGYEVIEKAISLQQDMKAVALLRPAQRPLSVSGLKGLLNNVTNSSATGTTKATLIDVQPAPQPANTRKVLTKRNTTVFKDQIRTQPEQSVSNPDKPMPSTTSTAPVHQELLSQLSHSERSEEPQPKLRRTQSKYIAESQHQQAAQETSSTSMCPRENVMVRSDGAYIDEEGNLRLCQYTEETDTVDEPGFDTNNGVLLPQPLTEVRLEAKVNSGAMAHNEIEQPAAARKHVLPPVSEPEEYWEQDEDEENYDEEGYVTARSFKSRGDNTTGGATTVLFPKINQKVKKELATAKQLIESTRTIEEIEDEAWDTSMVAEYGDEIFQYMRDLEVSLSRLKIRMLLTSGRRSRCSLTLTTWTTRRRFNGPCALFSWIGLCRFTIVLASFQKHCSSASITSIVFFLVRSFHLVSSSSWVQLPFSSPQSMRRSIAHLFRKLSTWLMGDTL